MQYFGNISALICDKGDAMHMRVIYFQLYRYCLKHKNLRIRSETIINLIVKIHQIKGIQCTDG